MVCFADVHATQANILIFEPLYTFWKFLSLVEITSELLIQDFKWFSIIKLINKQDKLHVTVHNIRWTAKAKDTITTTVTGVNSLHPSKLSDPEAEPPLVELEVQPTQKLTHLCKDRPKRPKNKVASRPVLDLEGGKEKEEEKEDGDADVEQEGESAAVVDAGTSDEGWGWNSRIIYAEYLFNQFIG